MRKFRLFKLILLTLFFFKILLTTSFSENETLAIISYDLETESKLWETLDKSLKEKKQKEQEEQRLKQAQEEQRLKQAQEEQRLKQAQEEQKQKEQEEQRLKQAQEEQKQKEQDKEIALLSKIFPENEASIIVKINNEIVTSYDLIVEIKYLESLNPALKNLAQEQKTKIAKESIIREKIKKQI